MIDHYLKFYGISGLIIIILLSLFSFKMYSTYEAKYNFQIFKEIPYHINEKGFNFSNLKLINKSDIILSYDSKIKNVDISVHKLNYRSCFKYGNDYMDSNFDSILINNQLFTRKDVITRDIILEKCNKNFNNITLSQRMERK